MEIVDIYDQHMVWIGRASRDEAHAKGLWHKTFQCWIVKELEQGLSFLFQRRSMAKDVFPNLLDKSCGGHLTAGEAVEDGVRELEEELGVVASFEDLIPCGVMPVETQVSSTVLDREFCHIFLYPSNRSLNEYQLQEEEVSGLYYVSVQDYFTLMRQQVEQITATGFDRSQGKTVMRELRAARSDFTPTSEAYLSYLEKGLHEIY